MRQRIPTLNLNLILNPKLDLISKLITVALLPTRPRDPIYTHSHSRISTLSHTHTLVCRPVVRCWEGHLGPSQSKRARVHVSHALPSPPYPPPTSRTHANGPPLCWEQTHTYTSRPYVYYVLNPITTTISLKCIRLLRRYTLACCALLSSNLRSPSIETRRLERNKAKAKKK